MNEKQPLMKISEVARKLNWSTPTLRNAVVKKDWSYCPPPLPQRFGKRKEYRWKREDVEAFANGAQTVYRTADKKAVPAQFVKYM